MLKQIITNKLLRLNNISKEEAANFVEAVLAEKNRDDLTFN